MTLPPKLDAERIKRPTNAVCALLGNHKNYANAWAQPLVGASNVILPGA